MPFMNARIFAGKTHSDGSGQWEKNRNCVFLRGWINCGVYRMKAFHKKRRVKNQHHNLLNYEKISNHGSRGCLVSSDFMQ